MVVGIVRFLYDGIAYGPGTPYLPQLTDIKGLRSLNGYDPLAPAAYANAIGKMTAAGIVTQAGKALDDPSGLLDDLRVTLIMIPPDELPSHVSPTMTQLAPADGLARFEYRPRVPGRVPRRSSSAGAQLRRFLDRLSQRTTFPLDETALVDTPFPVLSRAG